MMDQAIEKLLNKPARRHPHQKDKPELCMEQGKHKDSICREVEKLLQPDISRDSDNKQNSITSQEMMDTDQCIQKLIRTEPEGSERAQCKIENTAQYWVMKEKEAVINYHRALELNKSVSNKRVQQLYSQDQSQEMIDQAERQVASARQTLENIQRVEDAGLSKKSLNYPGTPRVNDRYKHARNDTQVSYRELHEQITHLVQAMVPGTERY